MNLQPSARRVARLLLLGYDTPRISRELGIRQDSVKRYCKWIYDETGQDDRISAVMFILRHPDALEYIYEVQ